MDGATSKIVKYALNTSFDDLPEKVRKEALRSLFNAVGCAFGGARHETVNTADKALAPFTGPAQATLFGRGRKSDILHAALINSLASNVYAFDDTHEQALVHPSGGVVTPILALAEQRPLNGKDFLTAFALGVEFVCRLCKAVTVPPAKGSIAWSTTGISVGFGAALSAAKLMGLDPTRVHYAIGIALSQAAGFRVMQATMCMSFMHAHSAQMGLRSAYMGEGGYTSAIPALEGKHGYLSVFPQEPDYDGLIGGLGERFEILRNTYKPYPCGIVIHPIQDACFELQRKHKLDAHKIAHVSIKASSGAMIICNRPHPQDEETAIVSLQHWTAVALLRGTASLTDLDTQKSVRDPAIQAFQDRIDAELDPSLAADAAVVTVRMVDGTTHTAQIDHCLGSAKNPLTDEQLQSKFIDQTGLIFGQARARELAEKCWNIETLNDVGDLCRAAA